MIEFVVRFRTPRQFGVVLLCAVDVLLHDELLVDAPFLKPGIKALVLWQARQPPRLIANAQGEVEGDVPQKLHHLLSVVDVARIIIARSVDVGPVVCRLSLVYPVVLDRPSDVLSGLLVNRIALIVERRTAVLVLLLRRDDNLGIEL